MVIQSVPGPVSASRPARAWRSRPVRGAACFTFLLTMALCACVPSTARDLDELIVQDSTYLDPGTMLPYSGPVARYFHGKEEILQLEATLREGTWEGELTVYHESGRVRYQGEMSAGAQCGGWIENGNPTKPESVYQAIREDLESLVMYPECPEG